MRTPKGDTRSDPGQTPAAARILVVEDQHDHVEVVRTILEDAGYVVEVACDGHTAMARLQSGPRPDLILLDLVMPIKDGWEVAREVKADPKLATIPIVTITGHGARALVSAPVSAGYLTKPVDPARLLETVEVCLVRAGRKPSGKFPIGS